MTFGTGSSQLKKTLIFVHRWMGLVACLPFLLWLASGIVLMYWDYPGVSEADRLNRAPILDASQIVLSPQDAYVRLQTNQPPTEVRLDMFDGRPVYRFGLGGVESIVYADDGEIRSEFPPDLTFRVAAAWTRQPPGGAKARINTEEDQWTVSGEFRAFRPMMKYSWPDGEEVYVSQVTGDVVQYTTRASRLGAYCGAIPHWLYFTSLRRHQHAWSTLVTWASGIATLTAIVGILVGVLVYSPTKRYRRTGSPSSIPYTGQKRWHMILGLTFGLLSCTWAFSGMLSMDPFPQLRRRGPDVTGVRLERALRGTPPLLSAFAAKPPREALAQVGSDFQVKKLELTSFVGESVYLATTATSQTRIIPVHGAPRPEFDRDKIIEVLRKAAQPNELTQAKLVTQYEAYYLDRHNLLPLPVIFVQLNDKEHSMYYVDPKTARIVLSYDSHLRWNRWLYHGLHSINLPVLYRHRPAWDIVVLVLMFGCTFLSITSMLLAWGVLRRKSRKQGPDALN